jgi:hypothetical protein
MRFGASDKSVRVITPASNGMDQVTMSQSARQVTRRSVRRALYRALLISGGTVAGTVVGWLVASGTAQADTPAPKGDHPAVIWQAFGDLVGSPASTDRLDVSALVPDAHALDSILGRLGQFNQPQVSQLQFSQPLRTTAESTTATAHRRQPNGLGQDTAASVSELSQPARELSSRPVLSRQVAPPITVGTPKTVVRPVAHGRVPAARTVNPVQAAPVVRLRSIEQSASRWPASRTHATAGRSPAHHRTPLPPFPAPPTVPSWSVAVSGQDGAGSAGSPSAAITAAMPHVSVPSAGSPLAAMGQHLVGAHTNHPGVSPD